MPVEELEGIWQVIQGGAQVAGDNIIQLPVDVAEAGAAVAEGVKHTVQVGNGAAAEVTELAVIEGGAATGTTTGLGLLSVSLPTAVAAAAPIFGLIAGTALYELAPEFWTNLSNRLMEAGQTVGGKIRMYLNGQTKTAGMSQQTLEIIKEALMETDLFNSVVEFDNFTFFPIGVTVPLYIYSRNQQIYTLGGPNASSSNFFIYHNTVSGQWRLGGVRKANIDQGFTNNPHSGGGTGLNLRQYTYEGTDYWIVSSNTFDRPDLLSFLLPIVETNMDIISFTWALIQNNPDFRNLDHTNGYVQPGATTPTEDPFPQTYPNYTPWSPPSGVPWPQELPDIYPVELPANDDNPSQEDAQNPSPLPDSNPVADWIIDNVVVPEPLPNPQPLPVPTPDPDPQPDPEPIPETETPTVDPDPPNPNPEPDPSTDPVFPIVPSGVDSNAMFTVYNPSLSQLNAFGGWLWSTNIITQILQMWQNPLDGIIAFMKVYATPSVGNSAPIQVGYLQSTASAPIVTSQFTTVDCGSVNVPENKHNATDYTPYTSIHIYLPFIGIVELDPDEIMNGSVNVKYHIDVYTGACLCEVRITRTEDVPSGAVLYTFTGNCAQQLPLTSASFAGALSAIVTTGIAIGTGGSGGALVSAAKMGAIGHSLTHDMVHIGHSSSLTANAGIMGARKPYIIIGRRHGYDANGYNELYGFPANKTVYLGNCSGYTRIKAGRLRTKASEDEKKEIMSLLLQGVIF